jgi:signal transduction histidine kinase
MKSEPRELFQQSAEPRPNWQPVGASPEEHPFIAHEIPDKHHTQASPHERSEQASSSMLREVAQITAQSFHSTKEAMRVALEVLGHFLDSQTLFIARVGMDPSPSEAGAADFDGIDQHALKIMEARNIGTSLPSVGSEGPLNRTYCQTVWQTRRPLIVEDVSRHPFYQQLPTTEEYTIGSYIGVPLIYSDGRVYGTLCSQDPHPRSLADQPEKLELMQIIARFLISHIEREEFNAQLRAAEQAQAQLASKLQEINNRFNEFLSIASHELKGPLTILKGNIQLARRTVRTLLSRGPQAQKEWPDLLEKIQRYLERAEQQVNVQSRLASDLTDVSHIRAGKLELRMQPCDLVRIVRETVENQRQETEDRVINLQLPPEQVMVHGDADRLGQVVNNYVTNALKYSLPDKLVEVALTTEGNRVRVTVSDQGDGLTPEEQERIWERFYRAKDVHVPSGHGISLGLGLHICKTIIEQHGGCVGLQSQPGDGSHFWFTLPLKPGWSS